MRTSRTIKHNQKNPPQVLHKLNRNAWQVEGRTEGKYLVTRSKDLFSCRCMAGNRFLCRHVQAVVRGLAEGKGYDLVQFWTDRNDAERQKRRTVRLLAGRAFWVTFANRPADAKRVWGMALPRIWETRHLFDDGTTKVFATNDGEVRYHANRQKGAYRPQHGISCVRIRFELFEPWFREVTA